jgi:hypothetical protein
MPSCGRTWWTGRPRRPGRSPSARALPCQRFDLKVDLPDGVWHEHGGVEVAIRWPGVVDPDDTLLEADETNNCGAVLIHLTKMGTDQRAAEIVEREDGC